MPYQQADTFIVAVVQTAPVFLNRAATITLACNLIAEAAKRGARLVVFPESFIPSYPDWVWAIPAGSPLHETLYAQLVDQAVAIPGPALQPLCDAARENSVYVVMGVSERNSEFSGSSLYNTLVYIDPCGQIMGKHRKLVPTGGERLVWAQGDGSTLNAYETPLGKIGGLICWENYMPLARYAMYGWGVQIYITATWDRGEPWLSTLRHIAKEGGVYVLSACIALRKDDIPDDYAFKSRFYQDAGEWINVGDSAIVNPHGDLIAGPLHCEKGILYADLDPAKMRGPKWMLDVAGHYGRPDVFQLTINRMAHPMIRTQEESNAPDAVLVDAPDAP